MRAAFEGTLFKVDLKGTQMSLPLFEATPFCLSLEENQKESRHLGGSEMVDKSHFAPTLFIPTGAGEQTLCRIQISLLLVSVLERTNAADAFIQPTYGPDGSLLGPPPSNWWLIAIIGPPPKKKKKEKRRDNRIEREALGVTSVLPTHPYESTSSSSFPIAGL